MATQILVDDDYREVAARCYVNKGGYAVFRKDGVPTYLHRHIAVAALGRELPAKAVVHHVDNDRLNSRRANLVVCNSDAHHMLIHARTSLLDAGYSPETHKRCCGCKEYLLKSAFSPNWRTWDGVHMQCRSCTNARRRGKGYSSWSPIRAEQQRARRARLKEAASAAA